MLFDSLILPQQPVLKGVEAFHLCPFHNDNEIGSFSINREKGLFYCHSCTAKGNIIAYVEKVYSLENNFFKTATFINKKLNKIVFPLNENMAFEPEDDNIKLLTIEEAFNKNLICDNSLLIKNKYLNNKFRSTELKEILALPVVKGFLNTLKVKNYHLTYLFNDSQKNYTLTNEDLILKFDTGYQVIKPDSFKYFVGSSKKDYLFEVDKTAEYIICEGLVTALSFCLIGKNAIFCTNLGNILDCINKYNYLKHKLFVSVDNDLDYKIHLKKYLDLGVSYLHFKGDQKGYDANDYLKDVAVESFTKEVETQLNANYSYSNFIKNSNVRVYHNQKMEYVLIINNTLFECGTDLRKVVNTIIQNLKWYKEPQIKDLRNLVEHFVLNNTKIFNCLGYHPDYHFLAEYHTHGTTKINLYKMDGLQLTPKNQLSTGGFQRIRALIDNLTENNFMWFSNFLACKIQKPSEKPHLGILIYSDGYGGTGKSTLSSILSIIFGKNFNPEISQDSIESGWNQFFFNNLLWTIEESESKSNSNILQKIKTALTADFLEKKEKFKNSVMMENFGNGIILSDKLIPIKLEDNDNRRIVVFKNLKRLSEFDENLGKDVAIKNPTILKEIEAYYLFLLNFKTHEVVAVQTQSKADLKDLSKDHESEALDIFINLLQSRDLPHYITNKGKDNEKIVVPVSFVSNWLKTTLSGKTYNIPTSQLFCKKLNKVLPCEYKNTSVLKDVNYITVLAFIIPTKKIEELCF